MDQPSPIRENVPLAPLTTLGVGGPARYLASVASDEEIVSALSWAAESGLPVFLLGGGSNCVVADAGYPGLVLQNARSAIFEAENPRGERGDRVLVAASAGRDWNSFVDYCVSRNLQGVECLAGIPGLVGATPVQNVGAYGQEVADTIARVRALDRTTGEFHNLDATDCGFGYRSSRFNGAEAGRWIITFVGFALTPDAPPMLKYADLQKYFGETNAAPSLSEVAAAVREIRSRKGMVVREDDPDSRSAGSFFKNPTVPEVEYQRIADNSAGPVPHWPQADGSVKLSAAWLMEGAGLRRGFTLGNAGLSTKHVLAIVNRGGATAAEIVTLARHVQTVVEDRWGIVLSPEPVFVGFAQDAVLPRNALRAATY